MKKSGITLLSTYLVLKKFSNPNHVLNAAQIIGHLKSYFNLDKEPNRKTVYNHLSQLRELSDQNLLDCELEIVEKNNQISGQYIIPAFTEGEIKLLCDAIASSRFIGKTHSKDLINKLGTLYNQDLTDKYRDILNFKTTNSKSYKAQLYTSSEVLAEAISINKKVKFQYLKYNTQKELIPNRPENDGWKIVTPYKLIWAINHYYLFCRYENTVDNRFLRVDKIRNVEILELKGEPLPTTIDWNEYAKNQAFMSEESLRRYNSAVK